MRWDENCLPTPDKTPCVAENAPRPPYTEGGQKRTAESKVVMESVRTKLLTALKKDAIPNPVLWDEESRTPKGSLVPTETFGTRDDIVLCWSE